MVKTHAYSFRTDNEVSISYLSKIENKSEFLADIISKFCNGELVPIATAQQTQELKEMQIRKLRASTIKIEVEAKKTLLREHHLAPDTIAKVFNNKVNLLDLDLPKEISLSDGRLQCLDCGILFSQRAYLYMQIDDYVKHIRHRHFRELTETEKNVFNKLIGEIKH